VEDYQIKMKVLNSNKRKRKIKKTWKKRKNGAIKKSGWLTINIDLSDTIELDDWSIDKSRRIINSGKKDD
jgi:hypothetical protein